MARVSAILATGEPTCFRWEGDCRHGLRADMCLHGERWRRANERAKTIIEAALRALGVQRPVWLDGQPEVTGHHAGRLRCANPDCGQLITRAARLPTMYCSESCRARAKCARYDSEHRAEARARTAEWKTAFAAAQSPRPCEWCGINFLPRASGRTRGAPKATIYCSISCRNRANASRGGPRRNAKPWMIK